VTLSAGFAGANPPTNDRISRESTASFAIRPVMEDPSRPGFNVTVAARNRSSEPVEIALRIDWDESPKVRLESVPGHQRLAVGAGDAWTWYDATAVDGLASRFSLRVPAGTSYIALNPKYTGEDLDRFLGTLPAGSHQALDYGKSAEGRPLRLLKFSRTAAGQEPRPVVLVTARVHPDETAGSYAGAGAIRLLSGAGGDPLLRRFDVYVAPMANPDGVENGLCKLTAREGIDLSRDGAGSTDPSARALRELIDRTRPRGYLDLHQWWLKRDWVLSFVPEPEWKARLFLELERLRVFDRGWQITTERGDAAGASRDLRAYCARRWGTQAVSLSLAWGHLGAKPRTAAEMREAGASALSAFCATLK
jgi:hypothetical protein